MLVLDHITYIQQVILQLGCQKSLHSLYVITDPRTVFDSLLDCGDFDRADFEGDDYKVLIIQNFSQEELIKAEEAKMGDHQMQLGQSVNNVPTWRNPYHIMKNHGMFQFSLFVLV